LKLSALLLLSVGLLPAADLSLEAGVAKVDITPSFFGPMYGYANRRCGPANGTHDPLFAKALVLRTGDSRMAIVTLDLGSITSENLHREVAAKLGIPVLLLSASHTHSGPLYLDGKSPYLKELEQKIFTAVEQASQSMFPARLGVGRGSAQLGYNRLLLRDDGRSRAEEKDFATRQKMGELLAEQVLKSAKQIQPISPIRYPIQYASETLKFADRWDKAKTLEVGITTVLINREIAIAATPGEPLHKLQTLWKTRADVPHPLFYGYTYSAGGVWPGYIPDLRSAAYGGYGADASTRIEVGAGETIMQHHLINLYKLLGMWRDKPGQP